MIVNVRAQLPALKDLMEGLGVTERGRVQQYATDRILFRMKPYMPYLTGAMADLQTMVTSPATIAVNAPYARHVYEGIAPSGAPMEYTQITHPLAGPHWDQTMMQNEGRAIAADIENYARGMK